MALVPSTAPTLDLVTSSRATTLDLVSSSSKHYSTCIEKIIQRRKEFSSDLEVKASKDHWSELAAGSDGEEGPEANRDLFRSLCQEYGPFFRKDAGNDWLVVGEKIAEGGQADICEAKCKHDNMKYVVKIFEEGSSLLDLQKQWASRNALEGKEINVSWISC